MQPARHLCRAEQHAVAFCGRQRHVEQLERANVGQTKEA
jgi:hypothetical protein